MATDPLTDSELVAAARAGDREACGRLLERHQPMVLALATRLVRNPQVAQELAQESLLEAYLSIQGLRQAASFQSWLYGIVLNICHNHLRRQRVEPLSLEALAGGVVYDALPLVESAPDPYETAIAHELQAVVFDALAYLSPINRETTLLFYYEQLSVREIATLLGISVAAVKGRLHKSRGQLREYLAPLYPMAYQADRPERGKKMVKVTVADVVVQEPGHYVVVLLDHENWRILPIWVGPFEGEVIARHLLELATPRPLPHLFMANLLAAVGASLEEVRIETLREITYYAVAKLRVGAATYEVDGRPSDAIALALHTGSPVYVAAEIMDRAGLAVPAPYQTALSHKGLDTIAGELQEKQEETERKLQEAREAASLRSEGEMAEAHQKLLNFLFGEA